MAEHSHVASEVVSPQAGAPDVQAIPDPAINLTPKAIEMVKRTREKEGLGAAYALRVSVTGGG